MFIGICGSICAGKSTIAQYLVEHHGFTRVSLEHTIKTIDDIVSGETPNDHVNGLIHKLLPAYITSHTQSSTSARSKGHVFPSADDLLDFITKHWRERWVTTDIPTEGILDMYTRRPFFLLISVDAPLTVRWRRFRERGEKQQRHRNNMKSYSSSAGGAALEAGDEEQQEEEEEPLIFESFAHLNDTQLFLPQTGRLPLMSRATVRLLNTSPSLAHLYATLGNLDLLNPDRLRPSWDSYFMALASLAAQRSNCMKRRVGCVVVRDKRVISTGYNGTPRGLINCGEGGCGRCNEGQGSGQGLSTCLCMHAEENALLEAGRERVREGAVLYCDTCPCLTCSIKIAQVGISEVVYSQGYSMDGETAAVFRQAGVKLRQFIPVSDAVVFLACSSLPYMTCKSGAGGDDMLTTTFVCNSQQMV
ncbi:putative dCMP deaminase [Neurospora hispaniola]|uniref:Deoxycytidylate deaminase n=1 Tax=Neurospora hispaniola TaxID=588809 RepID=A0AAJ0IG91_9PEZI|nr:putative dCMP deaminase [Neurospora hispaniola]